MRVGLSDTLAYEQVAVDAASIGLHLQQRLAIGEGKALKIPFHVRTYDAACRFVAENLAIAHLVSVTAARAVRQALGDWRNRLPTCLGLSARTRHDGLR